MKNKTLIIEFFGLPGSGKTTVAKEVNRLLNNQGLSVCRERDIFLWRKTLSWSHEVVLIINGINKIYQCLIDALYYALSVRPTKTKRIVRAIKLSLFCLYLRKFFSIYKFDVCILDQWVLQEIWSIGLSGKQGNEKTILGLIGRVSKNNFHYVYFCMKPYEAAQRILKRGYRKSLFYGKKVSWIHAYLDKYYVLMGQIKKAIECTEAAFLVIDANCKVEENARSITEWVCDNIKHKPR